MNEADFEAAYDALAAAVDRHADDEAAFLARLALLLAHECATLSDFERALAAAADAAGAGSSDQPAR